MVGGNNIQERSFLEAFSPASLWNQEVSKVQGWLSYLSSEPSSSMPSQAALAPRLCLCLPWAHPGLPSLITPPWPRIYHLASSHSPGTVGTMFWGLEKETGQAWSLSLSLPVYKWNWEEEHHLDQWLLACDLQNNNADLDVKLEIQTLGKSGLLSLNPCPLRFIAVSTFYAIRVLGTLSICEGVSFLGTE